MDVLVALYIFLLAAVIGYLISFKVPAMFHNILLTGSSFLNGIILIGAMIVMGNADTTTQTIIGFIAVTLAAANAVGAYSITSRLLTLFKKNNKAGEK